MTTKIRTALIVIILFAAVVLIALAKTKQQNQQQKPTVEPTAVQNVNLPTLVDLGAGKCIPCKLMAPILEELKTEYKGKLQVIVIDVWENKTEAPKYGIKIIPTQIFYDASGKELYRHEGFFSKEDILAKLKEFGINLEKEKNNETN